MNNEINTTTTVISTGSIHIDGKQYDSIDDVPEPHKSMILKFQSGDHGDIDMSAFENNEHIQNISNSISVNGQQFSSIEDLPEPHRSALLKLQAGDYENIDMSIFEQAPSTRQTTHTATASNTVNQGIESTSNSGFKLFAMDIIHVVVYVLLLIGGFQLFTWFTAQ